MSLSCSANILFVLLSLGICSDISVAGSCRINTWCVESLVSVKDFDIDSECRVEDGLVVLQDRNNLLDDS